MRTVGSDKRDKQVSPDAFTRSRRSVTAASGVFIAVLAACSTASAPNPNGERDASAPSSQQEPTTPTEGDASVAAAGDASAGDAGTDAPSIDPSEAGACASPGSPCGGPGSSDPTIPCCDPASHCDSTFRACAYPAGAPCNPNLGFQDPVCAGGTACDKQTSRCTALQCLDQFWGAYCDFPQFQGIACCNAGDVCHTDPNPPVTRCCAPAGTDIPGAEASRCCGTYTLSGHNIAHCN
jgi:hypothetical protein